MTLTTLETTIREQESFLAEAKGELRRLMNELKAFRAALDAGNAADTSQQVKQINSLCTLVTTCIQTENRLDRCKEERDGPVSAEPAFDLDAARASLGCKLDHLRACCSAGELPE